MQFREADLICLGLGRIFDDFRNPTSIERSDIALTPRYRSIGLYRSRGKFRNHSFRLMLEVIAVARSILIRLLTDDTRKDRVRVPRYFLLGKYSIDGPANKPRFNFEFFHSASIPLFAD